MRIQLAAAVALAPLMMASGAAAQVVISTERTTPISTSTADNGNPSAITIANGGTIRLSAGNAITIDSSHNVTFATGGRVIMDATADGATALLVQGGNTSTISVNGHLTLTDNYTAVDSDNDGDLDGTFTTGINRYGIHVTGPAAHTGDIIVANDGLISLEGNQSAGVFIDTDVVGDVRNLGVIAVLGDDSTGLRITGDVNGDFISHGAYTARGENATGISIEGDISGAFVLGSAVTATGFRYTGALTSAQIAALDADDLLIGGPAVNIAGDIGQGILLHAHHVDDPNDTDDDNDGIPDTTDLDDDNDGVEDLQEDTANLLSTGSAPALRIGSLTNTVTIGNVGIGNEAYGLINRGIVTGVGFYEGISAVGMQIGVSGGQAVTMNGGLRNEGAIRTNSVDASATALLINGPATVGRIDNAFGEILATSTGDSAFDVVGIQIEAGATVNSIINRANITTSAFGEAANVYGVRDASGSVTDVLNTGRIVAVLFPTDDANDTDDSNNDANDEVITGQAVALDLAANTTGVTFIQDGVNDGDDGNDGIADPDIDNDGVDDLDEPSVSGAVILGSGADTVEIRNGLISGNVSFGAGADSLLIDGGAEVRGVLADADGLLDINVHNGLLDARQTAALTVSSLTLGADGDLMVLADGATGTAGGFNVNGSATIVSGAALGIQFTSLLDVDTRFVVIQATNLTAGTLDQSRLAQNSPYMYVVTAGVDTALNQVYVDARHRTAQEFGFIASETATYGAFYDALATDPELLNAFLTQTGRDGFFGMYEQILPDHSGGSLISLATGVDAVTRALAGRGYPARQGETSAWLQEINFYADKDRGNAYGFRSEGFGFAGGVERGTHLGAFGVSVALTSSDLEDPESEAEEVLSAQLLELGLYWRAQGLHWHTWARGAAGYASFDNVRQLIAPGINRRSESDWNGYSVALAAGAAYDYQTGRWSVRPEAIIEYFRLNEGSHSDFGGGDGFDLAYEDREGHILSSTLAVSVGAGFGENNWLRPEIRVGWRQIISHDPGVTVASFLSTGAPFQLSGDSLEGGGPILGFRLNLGNELGFLSIEADAEMIEDYVRYALLLRASFRF